MIVVVLPAAMDLDRWPPVASRELLSATTSNTSRAQKRKMMKRSLSKVTLKVPRMETRKARTRRKRTRKMKERAVTPAPMTAIQKATLRIVLFRKSLPQKKRSSSLIVVD